MHQMLPSAPSDGVKTVGMVQIGEYGKNCDQMVLEHRMLQDGQMRSQEFDHGRRKESEGSLKIAVGMSLGIPHGLGTVLRYLFGHRSNEASMATEIGLIPQIRY